MMATESRIKIAENLLKIGAIKLSTDKPFIWTSGVESPIYCDNRLALSYPEITNYIVDCFVDLIRNEYPKAEVLAGVATAGIPWAAIVANKMSLPMAYVRSSAKGHGLENQIEGKLDKDSRVVVLEDLVSTGKSSLAAVDTILKSGGQVLGMVAIFTYGFEKTTEKFRNAGCNLSTLTDFKTLREINPNLPNFQIWIYLHQIRMGI